MIVPQISSMRMESLAGKAIQRKMKSKSGSAVHSDKSLQMSNNIMPNNL
jgi:hypothetical protein